VVVIPNAADIKIKLKPYKNYDNKKPLNIVFVGRLTYRRGVDLLIDILEDFLQRFSYCRFKIIGDGVKFPILKRFIEDRNLI
jgi:glycosyltransferase involved in cell wall biosynthesis